MVVVALLAAILRNELGWYDKEENNSSQILARLNSDATNVRGAIGDRVALMLQNFTLVLVSWTISIFLQWKLSLVLISVTPLLVLAAATQVLTSIGSSLVYSPRLLLISDQYIRIVFSCVQPIERFLYLHPRF